MERRDFLKKLGIGGAGIALSSQMAFAEKVEKAARAAGAPLGKQKFPFTYDEQALYIGENIAVTNTTNGKVRGYILRDMYYFLGIPYGADTAGKNRFMPPVKPEPWSKTFPAIWYPNCAPQVMSPTIHSGYFGRFRGFRDHENYDDISENCLGINVWTPGYNDGVKRPVLLWIHGGGWSFGNCIEHDDHNGENLAREGNIVFCSINHRLGPLGYTNLAAVGDERFAQSGNVGAMDMVLALEWIRDNIENFGGDPNNVTLAGHSGGANKICTLMTMPSAKGLFHKAVLMSGAIKYLRPKDITLKCGEYIMREAGLKAGEAGKL
ncbi:MAG: carboxylesterase family protein [Bacteroides sp.]|nr:carboxylesterase family protein [Bacteroides sp.]